MARTRHWFERSIKTPHLNEVPVLVRRVIVAVFGGTILLIGHTLLVLPGPAIVVVPFGLAILGTEFVWARRWLRKARAMLKETKGKITGRRPALAARLATSPPVGPDACAGAT